MLQIILPKSMFELAVIELKLYIICYVCMYQITFCHEFDYNIAH